MRQDGYYWVYGHEWTIAKYVDGSWNIHGHTYNLNDRDFIKINEPPIQILSDDLNDLDFTEKQADFYQTLIKKIMVHISAEDGRDFLQICPNFWAPDGCVISEEEKEEMVRLREESKKEYPSGKP